ncbi:NfeD family protein [Methanosalsum natronophilum]|uniref:NfeD family protein n=1 Tax=Methanosalsum natronophilum TaxID=768733 RepID=UPI002169EE9E|nr:nodulation protein NfeD [Methanosalsum natronophilum]MCS3924340.1 membrane-bound serine protease (ClpP class) [Methanosalsum natronophilum]
MRKKSISRFIFFVLLSLLFFSIAPVSADEQNTVLVVKLSNAITPASDQILKEAINEAENQYYEAIILKLDTPGGGLEETFRIIELIENTDVPIIGYVHPPGAKAWSAGTIILISTDIAVMAPNTLIGSAQPVRLSEPVEDDKLINALVAFAREKASMHGRNETIAEEFITKNLNLNADQALDVNIIEYVAPNSEELLKSVHGTVIKGKELNTTEASIEYYEPSFQLAFLNIISNPLISSLLMLLGIYGLIFGISNPGYGPEIFGLIAITLGLMGMGFDVNIAALFLIIVGAGLLILELQEPGFGVFGLAGVVCVIIGSVLLIPMDYPDYFVPADVQIDMAIAVIIPSIVILVLTIIAIQKVMDVRKKKPVIGEMIGDVAEASDELSPSAQGYIRYLGEFWRARTKDGIIQKGEKVKIVDKDGPILVVEPLEVEDNSKEENKDENN